MRASDLVGEEGVWGGGGEFQLLHILTSTSYCLSLSLSLFFFFWLHWVFIAECKFSLVAAREGCSLVAVCGLLLLMASLVAEDGL